MSHKEPRTNPRGDSSTRQFNHNTTTKHSGSKKPTNVKRKKKRK